MLSKPMLLEEEGCRILGEVFTKRGFPVVRDVPFDESGVSFHLDGWSDEHRVGFEYRTSEAGDKDDLTPDELGLLAQRMEAGELYIFVIDDTSIESADDLRAYASAFLDEVERRGLPTTTAAKKVTKKTATKTAKQVQR